MSKLTQVIDELVEKQTFSLSAVDAIKQLRDKASVLEDAQVATLARENTLRSDLKHLQELFQEKLKRITELEAREASIMVRERTMAEHEKNTAVAQAQASAWNDAFHTVFRNTVFRENTARQMPTTYTTTPSGYTSTNWEQKSESITREQE